MVRAVVPMIYALLLVASAAVFLAFDRASHSASDTIRPFLLTMVPMWIVAVVATRMLARRG